MHLGIKPWELDSMECTEAEAQLILLDKHLEILEKKQDEITKSMEQ